PCGRLRGRLLGCIESGSLLPSFPQCRRRDLSVPSLPGVARSLHETNGVRETTDGPGHVVRDILYGISRLIIARSLPAFLSSDRATPGGRLETRPASS